MRIMSDFSPKSPDAVLLHLQTEANKDCVISRAVSLHQEFPETFLFLATWETLPHQFEDWADTLISNGVSANKIIVTSLSIQNSSQYWLGRRFSSWVGRKKELEINNCRFLLFFINSEPSSRLLALLGERAALLRPTVFRRSRTLGQKKLRTPSQLSRWPGHVKLSRR